MKWMKSVVLASVFCFIAAAAFGQSVASLNGTVTDPTGAVVPGAQVTLHSLATGLDNHLVTDSAGLYVAPSLIPGDYSISATATGFGKVTISKVTLDVDSKITENLKLSLASAGETVQVEASTAGQIETSTITVGQVIDNLAVQELPLNGRHFLDLTVLTPGGVVANSTGSLTATSRGLGANSFLTAGNREDSVNFQINGINLNDISQNQITFQPSISTTSEFKINNQSFSAEYGRSDGSIVTVATRSGTTSSTAKRSITSATKRWMLATISIAALLLRPVFLLPATRATRPRSSATTLAAWSAVLSGAAIRSSPSATKAFASTRASCRTASSSAPRNELPTSRTRQPSRLPLRLQISFPPPIAATTILHLRPARCRSTSSPATCCTSSTPIITCTASMPSRRMFARSLPCRVDTIPGWGDHRNAHRQIGTLSYVHTFTPSITNEARLGFNRIAIAFNPSNLISPASVGIVDGLTGNVGLPQTSVTDLSLVFGGPSGFPQGRDTTTGVLADTVTMLKGKHQIKWGGEFRRYLLYSFAGNIGTLTMTQANLANDQATGFSVQPNIIDYRIYADAAGGFVPGQLQDDSNLHD